MRATVSSGFPNTRKPMKAQRERLIAFIVLECLETLGVCSKIMMFTMCKLLKKGLSLSLNIWLTKFVQEVTNKTGSLSTLFSVMLTAKTDYCNHEN